MHNVTFQFYGDLNDFLPERWRHGTILQMLAEHAAVKHPIESLGIPHTEVDAILVNRRPENFAYRVKDGDRVEVYPPQVTHLLREHSPLRPALPEPVRFVADTHLGQLAAYLRMLGFDTLYRNDYDDPQLASIAAQEERVLLTRDRGLLKHRIVVFGHCVRDVEPRRQIVSVLRRYRLVQQVRPWRRCMHCNGLLQPVEKDAILDRLQPKTKRFYEEFQQCDTCSQVYWQGSHFQQMEAFVKELLANV